MSPLRSYGATGAKPPIALQRVRLRLKRAGPAAYLSHLQQIETVRKALEKSAWPVSKSDSRKPKIKASFGPAISVGYESEAEYCDVELVARLDMKTAGDMLQKQLPEGYSLMSVKSIPRFFPSLDQTLNAGRYEIKSPLLMGTEGKWTDFWSRENFPVIKKKADIDVVVDARACVCSYALKGDHLELLLRFGPGRTLKPERIAHAVCGWDEEQASVGPQNTTLHVKRLQLYLEKENGELIEP